MALRAAVKSADPSPPWVLARAAAISFMRSIMPDISAEEVDVGDGRP